MRKSTFDAKLGFFDAGKEYTVNDPLAQRWISKRIAEAVKDGRETKQGDPKRHEVKREPAAKPFAPAFTRQEPQQQQQQQKDYEGMTVLELRAIARDAGIPNLHSLSKVDLISAIKQEGANR